MTTTPDEIRTQIEETRSNLSDGVNQLADAMTPSQIASRQVDKVKGAVSDAKDKVLGHDSATTSATGMTSSSSARQGATGWVRSGTGANPWAAGLVALGTGWIIGSLLPASSAEKAVAGRLKDTAAPVLAGAASEVADHLREPAQDAVDALKSATSDAVDSVREEGRRGVQETASQLPSS